MSEDGKKSSQSQTKDKQGAGFFDRDGGIMKLLEDGNITVKRHGSSKKKIRHTHEDEEKQLS